MPRSSVRATGPLERSDGVSVERGPVASIAKVVNDAHASAPEDVARHLDGDLEHGLSEAEAESRLRRVGPNRLLRTRRPAYAAIALLANSVRRRPAPALPELSALQAPRRRLQLTACSSGDSESGESATGTRSTGS